MHYLDGQPLRQGFHGNDFWQPDYDPATRTWGRTCNLPARGSVTQEIELRPAPAAAQP